MKLDRFLFHNSQYRILDSVRNEPWAGVPIPFAECSFEFLDSGLYVNTYVLQRGNILRTTYSRTSEEPDIIPLGCAEILLYNGRWPEKISIKAWNSLSAPLDCVYEFLRFYQRLSVYLAQPKRAAQLPVIERAGTVHRVIQTSDGRTEVAHAARDRIISLAPLTEEEQRTALHLGPQERKKQQHPCDYEFWVRGHMRRNRSGTSTWVAPFQKNKGKPAKSKTYNLKEGSM